MAQLRASELAQTCPLCREALPDGLEGMFELAYRGMVSREVASREVACRVRDGT